MDNKFWGIREEDIGIKLIKLEYSDWIKEGFGYWTRTSEENSERAKQYYESQGLEVRIGEKVFWPNGVVDPNLRAIFVKSDVIRKVEW